MTDQELEIYLCEKKEEAERELGCDMCGKYRRCLFCSKSEEYPCAVAHNRFMQGQEEMSLNFPAYLLPEPSIDEEYFEAQEERPAGGLLARSAGGKGSVRLFIMKKREESASSEYEVSSAENV